MPRIPATASVAFVILQRWTLDNLESCVHLLRKQEMKSCKQSLSNDLEVPFTGVRSTLLNMYNLGGAPHKVLFLVFAYLNVPELLVMSEACMLLRDAVDKDVIMAGYHIIEKPLNSRLYDEILV
ncbi:hypothetical protein NC652_020549 [Populus alba x Populus x berolinensis]|nr:hypothetical protein NC652_020549 [Populus alba x Populus x berolinensis]